MRAHVVHLVAVLAVTSSGAASAHRRLELELFRRAELLRPLYLPEPRVLVGVQAGSGAREATFALTRGERLGDEGGFVLFDGRLAVAFDEEAIEVIALSGTHRAALRRDGFRLDAELRHESAAATLPLRLDVVPGAHRDAELRVGVDAITRGSRDARFVVPLELDARRVEYTSRRPGPIQGFSRWEAAIAAGVRFDEKHAVGTAEMLRFAIATTEFEATPGAPGEAPVVDQFDARLINYDDIVITDGKDFFATVHFALGYTYLRERTRDEVAHAPVFRFGAGFEDRTGGLGLVYAMGPAVTDQGNVGTGWRVELSARGRKPRLGGWDARFGFTCIGDLESGPCDDRFSTRAAAQLEAYAEIAPGARVGAGWIAEHGPFAGGTAWRQELSAFVRLTP